MATLTKQKVIEELLAKGLNPEEYDLDAVEFSTPSPTTPTVATPVSATDAFLRTGKRSLAPSLVGIAAGSLAAAPFTGGSSLLVPLLVGAGAGTAASLGAGAIQEKILEKVQGAEGYNKGLQELEQARTNSPKASFAGELAPALLTARPSLNSLKSIGRSLTAASIEPEAAMALKSAALQAGVGGATEAGLELSQGQELSPGRIATQALAGGALTKPWGLGKSRWFGGVGNEPIQPTETSLREPATTELVPKERQLTLPTKPLSSQEHPLTTPWEGSSLKRQLDFVKAKQEVVTQEAEGLQGVLTGQQVRPPEVFPPKVNPQKTSMKGVERSNLENETTPISEGEFIQEEYDRGVRRQDSSQVAQDLNEYLVKSGRSDTSNEDIQKLALELADKQNVKRIIYDPSYTSSLGKFTPSTGEIVIGPRAALDTLVHEGQHALFKNIVEGNTTLLQKRVLIDAVDRLAAEGNSSPEEVYVAAGGVRGTKLIIDKLDKRYWEQLKTFVQDVVVATKARFGVAVSKEDVSRLLARWHLENARSTSPTDPVEYVAGRVIKMQEESELGQNSKEQKKKFAEEALKAFDKDLESGKSYALDIIKIGGKEVGEEKLAKEIINSKIGSKVVTNKQLLDATLPKDFNANISQEKVLQEQFDKGNTRLHDENIYEALAGKNEEAKDKYWAMKSQLSGDASRNQDSSELKPLKVTFVGEQEGFTSTKTGKSLPAVKLFNIFEDGVEGFPKGTTVTEGSLKAKGYIPVEESKFQNESELKTSKPNIFSRLGRGLDPYNERITLETKGTKYEETGKEVTKALNQYEGTKGSLEGRFVNKPQSIIEEFTPTERDNVQDKMVVQDITDGTELLPLTSREQELEAKLRKDVLVDIHDEQRRRNILIHGREAKDNPNYYPSIISREALDTLKNRGGSVEADKLVDTWAAYRVEQSKKAGVPESLVEAKKTIRNYIDAIGGKSQTSVEFNAINKAEGLGLPVELRDPDLLSTFKRYGSRVAKDFAWHDTVQSKPEMLVALKQRNRSGQLVDEDPDIKLPNGEMARDIYGQDYVRNAVDQALGRNYPDQDAVMKTSQVVTSALLGTGTGLRNLVALGAQAAPYTEVRDLPLVVQALNKVVTDFSTASKKAFEAGSYKSRINDIQFASNPDRIIGGLEKAANLLRKVQGADLLERVSRIYSHTLGDILATAQFQRSVSNDPTAVAFLKKFGHTVEGGIEQYLGKPVGDIPAEVVQRVAKEFVDVVQGSYDGRELPLAALNSPYAPFLTLSRWSIGRMNRVYKDVVQPLHQGNALPLLKYTLGTVLTGAAIQELNKLLSNKKDINPSVKEAVVVDNKEELLYSIVSLMQLGSFGGIVGDLLKGATDIKHGQLPRGQFTFPLASFVEDVAQDLADASTAISEGSKTEEVALQVGEKILRNSIQSYRYAANNTFKSGDVERSQKFRDLETFKRLSGQPTRPLSSHNNEFVNREEKEFKRETDVSKAVGQELPGLIKKAIAESNGDYEVLRKKLRSLKANSYQVMPSPSEQPRSAKRFMEFLDKTVGVTERQRRVKDYYRQGLVNKFKSSAVPSL